MKLTKAFTCVLPGEIYPVELPAGQECPSEYEESAREQGCLGALGSDKEKAAAEKAAAEAAAKEAEAKAVAEAKAAAEAAANEAEAKAAAEAAAKTKG